MTSFETYPKVEKAMKKLEKKHKFIYLPNFKCCGSCASAELNGFMGSPRNSRFDPYDFYVTFNEQTGENASDNFILIFYVGFLSESITETEAQNLVKESLLKQGLKETDQLVFSKMDITNDLWNSFAVVDGIFYVYGGFSDLEPEYEDEDDYEDEE